MTENTNTPPDLPTASDYLAARIQQFTAMNTPEVCSSCFCAWVRSHLKLGLKETDLEILQTMAPHFFIWSAAWKAKS